MKPLVLVPALSLVVLIGCSDVSRSPALGSAPALEASTASADDTASTSKWLMARKLIRSGQLVIHVLEMEPAIAAATDIATENGGFLSDRQVRRDEDGRSHASLTLKVPSERFATVVSGLNQLGQVEQESAETQDVTKAYFDLETRLQVKREMEQRLRAVLRERTSNVSDILEVER